MRLIKICRCEHPESSHPKRKRSKSKGHCGYNHMESGKQVNCGCTEFIDTGNIIQKGTAGKVYVDASGNGVISMFYDGMSETTETKLIDINELEFLAISKAVDKFGNTRVIYSDSEIAIRRAKMIFPNVYIIKILSEENLADEYTHPYTVTRQLKELFNNYYKKKIHRRGTM